jgi:hypothetical protein
MLANMSCWLVIPHASLLYQLAITPNTDQQQSFHFFSKVNLNPNEMSVFWYEISAPSVLLPMSQVNSPLGQSAAPPSVGNALTD